MVISFKFKTLVCSSLPCPVQGPLSIRDGSTAFKRSGWARCFISEGFFQLLTKLNSPLPLSSLSASQHLYFLLLSLSLFPLFFWLSCILLPLFCPSELMDLATLHPCCFWTLFLMKLGRLLSSQSNGRREGSGWRKEVPCHLPARGGVRESRGGSSACLLASPCRVSPETSATRKFTWCHVQLPHWECLAGMEQGCTFLCADSLVT